MPQFNLFKSSEQPVAKTPACPNCGRAIRLYDICNWYAGLQTAHIQLLGVRATAFCAREYGEVELNELSVARSRRPHNSMTSSQAYKLFCFRLTFFPCRTWGRGFLAL